MAGLGPAIVFLDGNSEVVDSRLAPVVPREGRSSQ